jgi:flagellar FliL protein
VLFHGRRSPGETSWRKLDQTRSHYRCGSYFLGFGQYGWHLLFAQNHAAGGAQVTQEEKVLEPPIYHAFDPAFVVNFKERGRTRYLQIEIQVMTRDPEVIPMLDQHMPVIRNNLLLLFSGQDAEKLHSADGKELLRTSALEAVQQVLMEQMGTEEPAIEALYFTSFVTQ